MPQLRDDTLRIALTRFKDNEPNRIPEDYLRLLIAGSYAFQQGSAVTVLQALNIIKEVFGYA
jgi:hypothetical protein